MVRHSYMPWVDKYRPRKLENVLEQDQTINILMKMKEKGNIPNLLFYGPPGTGKTSTIYALAMELFGPEKIRERVLELNASDERGIATVRNKIIKFAKCAISRDSCPDFKIIILDEADAMTHEAQAALRKVMETSAKITRFCLICNYKNQIIEPLESRCASFRFKSLKREGILSRVRDISNKEGLLLEEEALEAIITIAKGDARRAIMILQNLKYVVNSGSKNSVTQKCVSTITSTINKSNFDYSLVSMADLSVESLKDIAHDIINSGFPIDFVLEYFRQDIIQCMSIDDKTRSQILMYIADVDTRLVEGASEFTQLLSIIILSKSVINNSEFTTPKN